MYFTRLDLFCTIDIGVKHDRHEELKVISSTIAITTKSSNLSAEFPTKRENSSLLLSTFLSVHLWSSFILLANSFSKFDLIRDLFSFPLRSLKKDLLKIFILKIFFDREKRLKCKDWRTFIIYNYKYNIYNLIIITVIIT